MSLEAWGDDGGADGYVTDERAQEMVDEAIEEANDKIRKKQGGFIIGDVVEYIGQYKNDDGWSGYTFIICEIKQKKWQLEYAVREHDRWDGLVDGLLETDLRIATNLSKAQEGSK